MILKTKYKFRIVYKSGYYQDFWTSKFEIERYQDGTPCSVSFDKPIPEAKCFGLNNIESIWILKTKKSLF